MMFGRERAGGLQTAWPVLAGLAQAASIAMPGSGSQQSQIDTAKRNRVNAAILLTVSSPEFIVLK